MDAASPTNGGSADSVRDTAIVLGNQLDNRANRGVSDFDRTHRFVFSHLWDLPHPSGAKKSRTGRFLFSNWQVAGIITAMSGLPIDMGGFECRVIVSWIKQWIVAAKLGARCSEFHCDEQYSGRLFLQSLRVRATNRVGWASGSQLKRHSHCGRDRN